MKHTLLLVFLLVPYLYALGQGKLYTITYIVDGDTFDGVDEYGVKLRFRPIGIDTPETGKRKSDPEPYHQEAKNYTWSLLKGKKVRVEYDIDPKDYWGRDLVYVFLEDGTFFNQQILLAGWAQLMTIPPNVKYVDTFREAQQQAREQGRGVWMSN